MKSSHLVDPEIASVLEMLPPLDLSLESLPQIRAAAAAMEAAVPVPLDTTVARDELRIPGGEGAPDVRIIVYLPSGRDARCSALLHIHGGGFVLGSPRVAESRNLLLARELKCILVSVAYRLAPETAAPGSVEDCYAALGWIHQNAARLGIDPSRIGIIGESAGGGLAACLAILARDRGEYPISYQALIYPMLDDRTGVEAWSSHCGEFVWTPRANCFGWDCLLGASKTQPVSPYAAAARVRTVSGLPSAFIAVGALDLFLEEDLHYAQRLAREGVPVEVHVYPGAFHAFDLAGEAGVSRRFAADLLSALRRALLRPDPRSNTNKEEGDSLEPSIARP